MSYGAEKTESKTNGKSPATISASGLERMKGLAGTWVAADKDGKPTDKVVSVVKVTAAGSVVQETLFPGYAGWKWCRCTTASGPTW